jgi:rhamnosyl/mannosyltransferase
LIGGSGIEEPTLAESINKYGLKERVHLLGHVKEEEKYNYFQAASIFCLPSVTKAEAYGVVLIEAMAFGKPIVSSKIDESGMVWVNQDQVTGLQVPPRSPEALAKAIEQIGDTPELYQKFSDNGQKRYRDIFTRKTMIDALNRLYQKIV